MPGKRTDDNLNRDRVEDERLLQRLSEDRNEPGEISSDISSNGSNSSNGRPYESDSSFYSNYSGDDEQYSESSYSSDSLQSTGVPKRDHRPNEAFKPKDDNSQEDTGVDGKEKSKDKTKDKSKDKPKKKKKRDEAADYLDGKEKKDELAPMDGPELGEDEELDEDGNPYKKALKDNEKRKENFMNEL